MSVSRGIAWLEQSISDFTLVAVMDGSYIRELFPTLCLTAFILECSKGHGRVVGLFWKHCWLQMHIEGSY